MRASGESPTVTRTLRTFDERGFVERSAAVVREVPLEVVLDGRRLATIACSGLHVEELAVGFLRSEGLIADRDEVARVTVQDDAPVVSVDRRRPGDPAVRSADRTIGSSGARGLRRASLPAPLHDHDLKVAPGQVLALMEALLDGSAIHNLTHGTHAAALAVPEGLLVVREDIGRHNTLDMLGGHMLLGAIPGRDRILLTTGRVSAEIVQKVWRLGVPVLISHSAPTSRALELLEEAGITLVGYVRKGRMNLYTEGRRVTG